MAFSIGSSTGAVPAQIQHDSGCSLQVYEESVQKAEIIAQAAFEATMLSELGDDSLTKFNFEPRKLKYLGKRKARAEEKQGEQKQQHQAGAEPESKRPRVGPRPTLICYSHEGDLDGPYFAFVANPTSAQEKLFEYWEEQNKQGYSSEDASMGFDDTEASQNYKAILDFLDTSEKIDDVSGLSYSRLVKILAW
jgi:hypothetical protein